MKITTNAATRSAMIEITEQKLAEIGQHAAQITANMLSSLMAEEILGAYKKELVVETKEIFKKISKPKILTKVFEEVLEEATSIEEVEE